MDKVMFNVHVFFTMCQDFITNEKGFKSLDYGEKMRHRHSTKRRRGQFTAVTMADLMSWADSEEKWRIDGIDVVVVSCDNRRRRWPKLLKEEVSWRVRLIQATHNRAWDDFDRAHRDILASLVCTKNKMGQQGRMLSTEEQEAWLMSHCTRE